MVSMPSRPLARAFLAASDPPARDHFAALEDLEERLDDMLAMAELDWPAFSIPPESFAAAVARHAGAQTDCSASEALAALRPSDLYLATACAAGDPAALACFESSVLSQLPPALRHVGLSAAAIDDVLQKLRTALLVAGPDRAPGITRYSARGKLYSFVRSAAVRQAMKHMRGADRAVPDESALEEIAGGSDDPEMAHFKSLYREEFRAAFAEAMDDLSQQERNLLRQHYIDALSVRELGALYQAHHATAARWLASARSKLFAGTRDRLMARLGLGETGVASIIRLVHSQLDVSLVRRLGSAE